ncbi:phosphotransferase [Pseudomonas sp. F1_0610]|uniref:phosphotransferase n=1 Tax=Pseudomonas sp. F1_0610 TaxID=3114284 RepID=UPI0039C3239F
MKVLPLAYFLQLKKDAKILEQDTCGEKVLLLTDGSIIKLFRRKRAFTSAAFWPYAERFAKNAKRLDNLDVPVPKILNVFHIAEIERDIVHYQPLPGRTLRQLQTDKITVPNNLFEQLASFIAKLHQQGVLFRSIHLGNIVLTPDNQLGLIDFADLKKQIFPLLTSQRTRNFKHMLRYAEDHTWLASKVFGDFEKSYKDITGYRKKIL